jgi:O6-methylguanine-DNA--protein-cysteine methyltransferase
MSGSTEDRRDWIVNVSRQLAFQLANEVSASALEYPLGTSVDYIAGRNRYTLRLTLDCVQGPDDVTRVTDVVRKSRRGGMASFEEIAKAIIEELRARPLGPE